MTSKGIPKQGLRRKWGQNNATLGSFLPDVVSSKMFRPRQNTPEIIKKEKIRLPGQPNLVPGAIYSPAGVPVYSAVPLKHHYSPDVLDK